MTMTMLLDTETWKKQPRACYHCGNIGVLDHIAKYEDIDDVYEDDEYGNRIAYQIISTTTWHLFKCPTCRNPVLICQFECDGMPEGKSEITTLFPTLNINSKGVPSKIINAYKAAVRTKGIDNAICLIALRRTLEMICKDKGGSGKNLEEKIEDLIAKEVLPKMMRDACWIVRQVGNEAAHADDVTFSSSEVEEAIGFISVIIDYLYSMPFRMGIFRRKIESRKFKNQ